GIIDTTVSDSAPRHGRGTYLRGGIAPLPHGELFAIYWQARDFIAQEGDRNYSSSGFNYVPYYRSPRSYVEIGYAHRMVSARGLGLDLEARLHRMDHQVSSDPIIGTTWEYSYRVIARVPMTTRLSAER